MTDLRRGDICLVDFNPAKGKEMGKLRPAIIMSSKDEISILDTVIVIPLSTMIEIDALPYRFFVSKRANLQKPSDACIYEIRALSKQRIKEKIAALTQDEIRAIQSALCEILG